MMHKLTKITGPSAGSQHVTASGAAAWLKAVAEGLNANGKGVTAMLVINGETWTLTEDVD